MGTNPGWVDGFRAVQAMPLSRTVTGLHRSGCQPGGCGVRSSDSTAPSRRAMSRPWGGRQRATATTIPKDRTAVQRTTVTLLVKPDEPEWVKTVLGVYLYRTSAATTTMIRRWPIRPTPPVDTYIRPTSSIPQGTTSAWVQFVNATDIVQRPCSLWLGAEVDVEERDSSSRFVVSTTRGSDWDQLL